MAFSVFSPGARDRGVGKLRRGRRLPGAALAALALLEFPRLAVLQDVVLDTVALTARDLEMCNNLYYLVAWSYIPAPRR